MKYLLLVVVVASIGVSFLPAVTPASDAQVLTGQVVKIDRDESGLPYTYYYYIPNSAPTGVVRPLICIAYASPTVDSYEDTDAYARGQLDHFLRDDLAEASGLIMFTVAVPPLLQEERGTGIPYYPHRYNLQPGTVSEAYYRPDLKFISVVDHLRDTLVEAGFQPDRRLLMTGFSVGGVWTHRFALLHPDLVRAAAPGGIGMYTMPLSEWHGHSMPFPLGAGDFTALGLPGFNSSAFKCIPFFVFIGQDDTNAPLSEARDRHDPPEDLTYEEVVWFLDTFGDTAQARAQAFHEQLLGLGMNSTYRSYPGVKHQWTYAMKVDTINFFLEVIGEPPLASSTASDESDSSASSSLAFVKPAWSTHPVIVNLPIADRTTEVDGAVQEWDGVPAWFTSPEMPELVLKLLVDDERLYFCLNGTGLSEVLSAGGAIELVLRAAHTATTEQTVIRGSKSGWELLSEAISTRVRKPCDGLLSARGSPAELGLPLENFSLRGTVRVVIKLFSAENARLALWYAPCLEFMQQQ